MVDGDGNVHGLVLRARGCNDGVGAAPRHQGALVYAGDDDDDDDGACSLFLSSSSARASGDLRGVPVLLLPLICRLSVAPGDGSSEGVVGEGGQGEGERRIIITFREEEEEEDEEGVLGGCTLANICGSLLLHPTAIAPAGDANFFIFPSRARVFPKSDERRKDMMPRALLLPVLGVVAALFPPPPPSRLEGGEGGGATSEGGMRMVSPPLLIVVIVRELLCRERF